MSDVRANVGVPLAAQFGGVRTPTACAPIVVNSATGYAYTLTSAGAVVAAGAGGTVTSVAQSFTGGLISVAGSPITTTGTLALTVAGTSGGVPYFSGATTWASSAALASGALVLGGGAGAAPATTATGTGVVTALGVNVGSAGAFVTFNGALGTPASGTLTNCTGLPIAGTTGYGTGVATALAVNVGSAGAFVTFNGALGTPSSGTLTNATGLPAAGVVGTALVGAAIGTTVQAYDADLTTWAGITPGANVGTFLATPSSANLAAALTDETGSGKVVFDNAPSFTTGIGIGAAAAGAGGIAFPASAVAVADANTLDDYKESAETLTLTGCATAPTVAANVTKVGRNITISLNASLSATSNATAKTLTGLPAAYFPTVARTVVVIVQDNSAAYSAGRLDLATDGVMHLYKNPNADNWTASGTFLILPMTFSYSL